MAISTTNIGVITDVTTYTSVDDSAMTFMSLCNYGAVTVTVDIHIVLFTGTVGNTNLFIKGIEIIAGDTYVVYQGSEKIILGAGDFVSVAASVANSVTVITSSVQV